MSPFTTCEIFDRWYTEIESQQESDHWFSRWFEHLFSFPHETQCHSINLWQLSTPSSSLVVSAHPLHLPNRIAFPLIYLCNSPSSSPTQSYVRSYLATISGVIKSNDNSATTTSTSPEKHLTSGSRRLCLTVQSVHDINNSQIWFDIGIAVYFNERNLKTGLYSRIHWVKSECRGDKYIKFIPLLMFQS